MVFFRLVERRVNLLTIKLHLVKAECFYESAQKWRIFDAALRNLQKSALAITTLNGGVENDVCVSAGVLAVFHQSDSG